MQALRNLSAHIPCHAEIFRLGGLTPLVNIIETGNHAVSNAALAAMTNIAPSVHPPHSAIVSRALVGVLLDETANSRRKQEAVAGLRNLSAVCTDNADLVVHGGGVAPLVDLVSRGASIYFY